MTSTPAALANEGTPKSATAARAGSKGTLLLGLGVVLLASACYLAWQRFSKAPWTQGYRVVKVYPHDPHAYTQGLVFDHGVFHESTGQYGDSSVRTVEIETGKVLKKTEMSGKYFGEGLAQVGERLIQITWKENLARVYDKETLKAQNDFSYEGEGWGLVFDGKQLVMSDGS